MQKKMHRASSNPYWCGWIWMRLSTVFAPFLYLFELSWKRQNPGYLRLVCWRDEKRWHCKFTGTGRREKRQTQILSAKASFLQVQSMPANYSRPTLTVRGTYSVPPNKLVFPLYSRSSTWRKRWCSITNPGEKRWTLIAGEQNPLSYRTIQHSSCTLAPRCCDMTELCRLTVLLVADRGGTSPPPAPSHRLKALDLFQALALALLWWNEVLTEIGVLTKNNPAKKGENWLTNSSRRDRGDSREGTKLRGCKQGWRD